MRYLAGLDIGGTKCAVTLGVEENEDIRILAKKKFATKGTPDEVMEQMLLLFRSLLAEQGLTEADIASIGISSGGPLDSKRGIIQSPPNLPGWDDVHITEFFESRTKIPTALENDANACAIAEWRYGAGRGKQNVIFLTFGTGLGAGLILDGRLYSGTNGNAGEIGHVRLRRDGPIGYNKRGSCEGFCSGGGLEQQGKLAAQKDPVGAEPLIQYAGGFDAITAKTIADLADQGDAFCKKIYRSCGEMLGETLAILIDILNPECIILGGVYMRSSHLLVAGMEKSLSRMALSGAREVCEILPAGLGETVGDYAALSLAAYAKSK
ncbi:MAG: ROK family protein [Ruminococcaceae bacterium]|nr:ROK family protein [Oscillospiraceae bacterium]